MAGRALLADRRLWIALALAAALLAGVSYLAIGGDEPPQRRATALAEQAATRRRQGEPERAREYLDRALALDPACVGAHVELARLARARGDEREAMRLLRTARSFGGETPEADYELAALALGAEDELLRDPEYAVDLLRAWLERHEPSFARYDDFAVLLAAGLVDHPQLARHAREARQLAERVRARQPGHAGAEAVLLRLDGLGPR